MDILEKFSAKFGGWYEGLFGSEGGELRPKDVLRKIIAAMEDHRKEGFDSKVYVPNKYVLELAVSDPEERDYLLSFLDEEELVSVLKRFMAQHNYHVRGPLDFTVQEVEPDSSRDRADKLRVKVRFEKGDIPVPDPARTEGPRAAAADASPVRPASTSAVPSETVVRAGWVSTPPADDDDLATIAAIPYDDDDAGTVPAIAWASLAISAPDGRKRHESITRSTVTIGRSRNAGNDIVLSDDGKVSKQHARIERLPDGRFTIADLGSMNGVIVNGQRIGNAQPLADGDHILIGATNLTFHVAGGPGAAQTGSELNEIPTGIRPALARRASLVGPDGIPHILASETLIGRALTADIVLDSSGVSMRHARIVSPDPASYFIEDLGSDGGTFVDGRRLLPGTRAPLSHGGAVKVGPVEMRFVGAAQ